MSLQATRFNEYIDDETGEYQSVRAGEEYPTEISDPKRTWLIENGWAVEKAPERKPKAAKARKSGKPAAKKK